MTPQEKAKELVLQFSDIGLIVSLEAKQCALIAVDEISNIVLFDDLRYWDEVKQEIEEL
jgi:hypothetical protein